MKDQVEGLNQAGVHAAYLNSLLTQNQYFKALDFARAGRYPIIYVAPERLLTDSFLSFALNANISMVAVDESHCVSQWGTGFPPQLLKNHRIYRPPAGAPGGQRVHRHRHKRGAGRYHRHFAASGTGGGDHRL